ncbi:hypothetical protein MRX96_051351 [Rhipicephalus microplus]
MVRTRCPVRPATILLAAAVLLNCREEVVSLVDLELAYFETPFMISPRRSSSCPTATAVTPTLRHLCIDDALCAAALDRVYRHAALVAELSKVLAISEADAAVAVRQGYRSIEGMHEFMRLAGVVKARVTCYPRDVGRPQLDALDEHCWAHVRRYLMLDDVAWPCRSSMNVP